MRSLSSPSPLVPLLLTTETNQAGIALLHVCDRATSQTEITSLEKQLQDFSHSLNLKLM